VSNLQDIYTIYGMCEREKRKKERKRERDERKKEKAVVLIVLSIHILTLFFYQDNLVESEFGQQAYTKCVGKEHMDELKEQDKVRKQTNTCQLLLSHITHFYLNVLMYFIKKHKYSSSM
jgi:hypothetical protein